MSATALYGEALLSLRRLRRGPSPPEGESLAGLEVLVLRLLRSLEAGDQTLLALTARPEGSVGAHCVNTAILSLWVALGKEWPADLLAPLGAAALLHAWNEPRGLIRLPGGTPAADECRRLRALQRRDPAPLLQSLAAGGPILASAAKILAAERLGPAAEGGYSDPTRLSAELFRICDAYSAMSHPRGQRKAMPAHEAVKSLIKLHETQFDGRSVVLFVSRMSLFPPGTCVRLSNGDIGYVTQVHANFPTRPTVQALLDQNGALLRKPELHVLKGQATMNALKTADFSMVKVSDRRLGARLRTARMRPA